MVGEAYQLIDFASTGRRGTWRVVQMKKAFLILLFTLSAAFADNQNIYDFFRQLPNSDSAIVDEQTTAVIERHIANLVYPVDMVHALDRRRTPNFTDRLLLRKSRYGHQPVESYGLVH